MINFLKWMILRFLSALGYVLLKQPDFDVLNNRASMAARLPQVPVISTCLSSSDPSSSEGAATLPQTHIVARGLKNKDNPLEEALCHAAQYIIDARIPGDVVDCGTGETSNLRILAMALKSQGATSRRLILFDTTMNPAHRGEKMMPLWGSWGEVLFRNETRGLRWPPLPEGLIPTDLATTGYPVSNIDFVTQVTDRAIRSKLPPQIALLMLTCDTYKANSIVLSRLLPQLAPNAMVIVRGYSPDAASSNEPIRLLHCHLPTLVLAHVSDAYWMGTASWWPVRRYEKLMNKLNQAIDDRDSKNARIAQGLSGDVLRRLVAVEGGALKQEQPLIEPDSAAQVYGRTEIHFSSIPQEGTAVLLIFGQSNASNEGEALYDAKEEVYNWNVHDNRFYVAKDPLLGTTGVGGGFSTQLGDLLVSSGKFRRVVLANVAIGGTYIHDWTPAGRYHGRIIAAIERLRTVNLSVTHVLCHQGEGDAAIETDEASYQDRFMSIAQSMWLHGLAGPIYIATASLRDGSKINPEIRQAQRALVNNRTIFAGPDTDTLGGDMRMHDGCHLNKNGVTAHAKLWLESLCR
jgi:hypothetical protein